MRFDPDQLPTKVVEFLTQRHLVTLTTTLPDGSPHVTPVGVSYDQAQKLARVITWSTSVKARNAQREPGQRVAICQHDGARWLTLYGRAFATNEPDRVRTAVEHYAARYRWPKERSDRLVIEVVVEQVVGQL